MKHNHVPMKLLAFLGCILILFGSVPKARAWTLIKVIFITFDTSFKAGNEIPYSFTYKSDPKDSDLIFAQSPAGDNGKNGVLWEDITDKYNVVELNPYDHNRFLEGHRYKVTLYPQSSSNSLSICFGEGNLTYAYGTNVSTHVRINDEEASVWSRGAVEFLGTPYTVGLKVWYEFEAGGSIPTAELPIVLSAAAGAKVPFRKDGIVSDSEGHCHIDYGRTGTADGFTGAERWYDVTDGKYLVSWDTFQTHHVYQYSVIITANKNWVFRTKADGLLPDVRVRTQNGIEAIAVSPVISSLDDDGLHEIVATFQISAVTAIPEIRVTGITEPAAGAKPDYTASASGEGYRVRKYTSQDWLDGVMWMDQTTETVLSPDSAVFKDGHTYRCYVQVLIDEAGYAFANDGTKPTVKCYMDGKEATVGYGPNDDFRSDLWLYRDYEARIPEIDSVSVTGVTWPAPGEKPVYDAQMPAGAAYELENFDNGSWYNGIYWEDMTDNETLDKDDVFRSGHTYRITVSLVGKNGAVFTKDDVSATVNGKEAESVIRYESWNIGVTATFQCVGMTVHAVHLGIQSPEAGGSPDWNVTVTEPGAHYALDDFTSTYWKNGVIWHDMTADKDMGENDRFAAGHQYRVTVSVVTKDGYVFGNYQDGEVEAYLGDERADEIDDWEEPETNIGLRKTYTVTAKWLPGDANEDGKVDMLDALRVLQYVNGKTGVINLKNADVTGDGKAAIEDARLIGQYAAGWNVGLK